MLKTFEISSSARVYKANIGVGNLVDKFKEQNKGDIALIDRKVYELWFPLIDSDQVILIDAVEENKTLEYASYLIELMRENKVNRKSHLRAYGGGIVQDLSTFIASVYMRGLSWTYYPTTLLGMVDSCVGGKSSLNVGKFKNIAGNYYPPEEILIDIDFCKTLHLNEKIAGLCEAAKICFADESNTFDTYLKIFSGEREYFSSQQLFDVVALSLSTKKIFIEEDEFDEGIRLLLNFGHTFGHAIEGASKFSITHGVAVGVGMLAEIKLAKIYKSFLADSPRTLSLISHIKWLLSHVDNLAPLLEKLNVSDAMLRFKSDKKHTADSYSVVMVNEDGFLEKTLIPINEFNDNLIIEVFKEVKKDLIHD
jgi:3-dehydroquinate synthase